MTCPPSWVGFWIISDEQTSLRNWKCCMVDFVDMARVSSLLWMSWRHRYKRVTQGVSTKFQNFFHDFSMTKVLKWRTFYMLRGIKVICTEVTSSHRGHELLPVLPLRTMHKVPVTVQENVEDTKIWSDYTNISLYWNAGWKKGTAPFHESMLFNLHDFLSTFQNLECRVNFHDFSRPGNKKWNSMTFPGFPWLDTLGFKYLDKRNF